MRDVTTKVTLYVFCILSNSQAILMLNPIFHHCIKVPVMYKISSDISF